MSKAKRKLQIAAAVFEIISGVIFLTLTVMCLLYVAGGISTGVGTFDRLSRLFIDTEMPVTGVAAVIIYLTLPGVILLGSGILLIPPRMRYSVKAVSTVVSALAMLYTAVLCYQVAQAVLSPVLMDLGIVLGVVWSVASMLLMLFSVDFSFLRAGKGNSDDEKTDETAEPADNGDDEEDESDELTAEQSDSSTQTADEKVATDDAASSEEKPTEQTDSDVYVQETVVETQESGAESTESAASSYSETPDQTQEKCEIFAENESSADETEQIPAYSKQLQRVEMLYARGAITLSEYEQLKEKYNS